MDRSKNPQKAHSQLSQDGDVAQDALRNGEASPVSMDHLKRLVQLLDQTDIAELELKRPHEGMHLVLRKLKATGGNSLSDEALSANIEQVSPDPATSSKRYINAHLVGTFHMWGKPRGGSLVAVGDYIKVGQLVGTIESLNVINEVESTIAGRVTELLVQEGQPVEYGQHLIVLESDEEETEA
jgi:acetyl-CoA carboxylase biotin carboxyl carrier protein